MAKNNVLLLMDNTQSARHLTTLLQDAGYSVNWQPLNETALRAITVRPDLIIFDSLLLDDEEFCIFSSLRQRESWRDIPILVIATILDRSSKVRVRSLAADEIVTKPIDPTELLVKVKSMLRVHSFEIEASSADKGSKPVDPKDIQQLATEDPLANLSYIAARQASEHSLETIFVHLLRYTQRMVPCDEGVICVEVQPGRFGTLAQVGGGQCDVANYYEIGESYTGWMALHKKPLIVNDVSKESRVRMQGREQGRNRELNSFVGVPLIASDRVIGTLELVSCRRHNFKESTLEILRPIAQIAAIAIETVRARRDFAEQVHTLWREFDRYREQWLPIYESQAMERIMKAADKVKDSKCAVLITGETGTGKELIARFIHFGGNRKHFPYVDLNCAAVPESLQEAELFGIEKGVATGVDRRVGKFELAGLGTLFLDEVAYMPLVMQSKILRVLQERTFERVGGAEKLPFQGRIIAATSREISQAIREGAFREELYYRLAVIHLHIPPLRERREDIPPLVRHYVRLFCEEQNRPLLSISPKTLTHLMSQDWPGNVRELRNALERAVLLSQGNELEFVPQPSNAGGQGSDGTALLLSLAYQQELSIPELLNRYTRYSYERLGRNKAKACSWLKINYRTLCKRLQEANSAAGSDATPLADNSTDCGNLRTTS